MARPRFLKTASILPRFAGDPAPRFAHEPTKGLQTHFDVTVLGPAHPKAAPADDLEGVRVGRYLYAPARSLELLAYSGAIVPRLRPRPACWALVPLPHRARLGNSAAVKSSHAPPCRRIRCKRAIRAERSSGVSTPIASVPPSKTSQPAERASQTPTGSRPK